MENELGSRFDRLEAKIDGGFGEVDRRLEGLEGRFDGLETRLTLRTGRLEERIDATEREMKGGFASLERGQELILKAVRGHTTSLEAVDKSLRELDRRVSRLDPAPDSHRAHLPSDSDWPQATAEAPPGPGPRGGPTCGESTPTDGMGGRNLPEAESSG